MAGSHLLVESGRTARGCAFCLACHAGCLWVAKVVRQRRRQHHHHLCRRSRRHQLRAGPKRRAFRAVLGKIDVELATVDFVLVELFDALRGFVRFRELDESEPSRPPSVAVGRQVDVNDLPSF